MCRQIATVNIGNYHLKQINSKMNAILSSMLTIFHPVAIISFDYDMVHLFSSDVVSVVVDDHGQRARQRDAEEAVEAAACCCACCAACLVCLECLSCLAEVSN
jgi:hypothetical protein